MNYILRDKFLNALGQKGNQDIKIPGDGVLRNIIERDLPKLLYSVISNESLFEFSIEGSIGKGKWAIIPWVAIMNQKITRSVSEGHYIVFLFSLELGKVFLTLNQGTGGINRAKSGTDQSIIKDRIFENLSQEISGFIKGEIPKNSLDSRGRNRPRAYEKACILWKSYDSKELHSLNDKIIISDINDLLTIYNSTVNDKKKVMNKVIEPIKFRVDKFYNDCSDSGLNYTSKLITRYTASLVTKPFVLLTGLSGSGKTKLAQSFAQWLCESEEQYCIVPVGADWTNREPLLGYVNALNPEEYIIPENGALELIINANKNQNKPYFLILDEMNLSHVERYFADFLSVMESNDQFKLHSGSATNVPKSVSWSANLFIVGTVNIDETTYMFSPKVLDRANVIEFRVDKPEMTKYLSEPRTVKNLNGEGKEMGNSFVQIGSNKNKVSSETLTTTLIHFFEELQKVGAEFGYRTASEIQTLFGMIELINPGFNKGEEFSKIYSDKDNFKIDLAIMQKLLPKIHGSRRKLSKPLTVLAQLCLSESTDNIFKEDGEINITADKIKYPLSFYKIARMYKSAIENGFASYAEA